MKPARARLGNLIAFVGHSTLWSLGLLWVLGLLLFLLELGFASLVQQFLAALGLILTPSPNGSHPPLTLSLKKIVFLIFIVSTARAAVTFAQGVIDGGAIERFSHRIRGLLIESCLDATSVRAAETLTFFNQRVYTASMAIHSVQILACQGILALGLLISLFLISPLLTLLMSLVVLAISLPVRNLSRRVKKSSTLHIDALSKIMLHLNNVFRNFLLIRLYNLQASERARLQGHLRDYSKHVTHYYWVEGFSGTVVPLLIVLNILWVALVQNSAAAIDRSLVVPYLYLSFRFAQNLAPIVNNVSRLSFASPEFRHVFHWWLAQAGAPARASDASAAEEENLPVGSAIGWKLDAVTFGYPHHPDLFNDFHLEVKPGSLLLMRGSSGVGKSSLVRLMVGEARQSVGSVEVQLDGKLFPVIGAAARLRNHIGYSGAEPFLFEGTIYENVTYGLRALPARDFLLESTVRAECQFICDLPEQFEHRLDELGQGLSTGQKQRLSLLRALLRKPRALILDEALSNVDIPTENRILDNLIQLKRECTIIFISHREHPSLSADVELNMDGRLQL